MKRHIIITIVSCMLLLVGCQSEQTFEEFFHEAMTKKKALTSKEDFSYSLIHKELHVGHKGDAIAAFSTNRPDEQSIYIAYFEKENGGWEWKQTRGGSWDDAVNWSSMHERPYIYSGAISDPTIAEVYAGEKPAKIINVENDKRFWYVISPIQDVKVKYVKEDGAKEIIEEINHEELQK